MGTVVDTKYGYLASGIILVIVPSIPLLAVLLVPSDDPFPFLVVLTLVPIVKSFVLLVKIKSLESHPSNCSVRIHENFVGNAGKIICAL